MQRKAYSSLFFGSFSVYMLNIHVGCSMCFIQKQFFLRAMDPGTSFGRGVGGAGGIFP